jgi:hypothetical protein
VGGLKDEALVYLRAYAWTWGDAEGLLRRHYSSRGTVHAVAMAPRGLTWECARCGAVEWSKRKSLARPCVCGANAWRKFVPPPPLGAPSDIDLSDWGLSLECWVKREFGQWAMHASVCHLWPRAERWTCRFNCASCPEAVRSALKKRVKSRYEKRP